MIFLSLTSPFDYNVATPYLTNGRYDSVPIGDIFPESCGEPKNQWEYDGHGLHTTMGTISIIHSELAPWSKESTCGIVIHPTMGSLQLEYKSLLTHLTMAYRCKTWVLDDSAWFIGFCHSAACQNPGAMGLWPTISTNFIWYMGVSENGETCHFLIDLNSENSGIPWFQTHSSSSQLTWLWKQCQLRFWKSPLKNELI